MTYRSIIMPLVVHAAMTGCATSQKDGLDFQVNPVHMSHDLAYSTDRLHRLKIGEVDSVESSYEFYMAYDVKMLYQLLDTQQFTEQRKERIFGQIRLISVMHEKYPVAEWEEDRQLIEIFKEAQSRDMKQTEWFRCRDWSQPMWAEESKCPCNKQGLGTASQPPQP